MVFTKIYHNHRPTYRTMGKRHRIQTATTQSRALISLLSKMTAKLERTYKNTPQNMAVGWSEVCDCGNSGSYSLSFFYGSNTKHSHTQCEQQQWMNNNRITALERTAKVEERAATCDYQQCGILTSAASF